MSIPANGFYFTLYFPLTNYSNVGKTLCLPTGIPVLMDINFFLPHVDSLRIYCELILFLLFIFICYKFFSLSFSAYLNFNCSSTRKELLKSYNRLCKTGFRSLYFLAYCGLNIYCNLSFILFVIRWRFINWRFSYGLRVYKCYY